MAVGNAEAAILSLKKPLAHGWMIYTESVPEADESTATAMTEDVEEVEVVAVEVCEVDNSLLQDTMAAPDSADRAKINLPLVSSLLICIILE